MTCAYLFTLLAFLALAGSPLMDLLDMSFLVRCPCSCSVSLKVGVLPPSRPRARGGRVLLLPTGSLRLYSPGVASGCPARSGCGGWSPFSRFSLPGLPPAQWWDLHFSSPVLVVPRLPFSHLFFLTNIFSSKSAFRMLSSNLLDSSHKDKGCVSRGDGQASGS